MQTLIQLSVALIGGLLMSRLAKKLNLPAVTAYLVAGLLLGPFCIGALHVKGLGFNTAEEVAALDIISQAALGFIAFTIGNEFRLDQLKHMGKQAITVGILQAVGTTVLVVTHEKNLVNRFTKRVVAIENGRIISDETGGYYNVEKI